MRYARKRSEAGGDVQLFNPGATHSDGPSGAADSRACGPGAGAHGCRIREVVLRHGPSVDRPRAAAAGLYSDTGRPSIAPERLLRATLLMILYSIRSERQLMEQMNYNLLFRWFVGLEMDDAV